MTDVLQRFFCTVPVREQRIDSRFILVGSPEIPAPEDCNHMSLPCSSFSGKKIVPSLVPYDVGTFNISASCTAADNLGSAENVPRFRVDFHLL